VINEVGLVEFWQLHSDILAHRFVQSNYRHVEPVFLVCSGVLKGVLLS
jgi:hypothetical protein